QSAQGHQLRADSSYQPDQSQFPDMGAFSKGISFTWAGRAAGDNFAVTLAKSNKLQKAFMKNGGTATLLSPVKEDSASLTVAFGIGDSGKVIFLARQYPIAANIRTGLSFGKDSVAGLLSKTPGDLGLDTNVNLTGLALDSFRVWTKRRILPDNLDIQEPFTIWLDGPPPNRPERLHAFVKTASAWDTASITRAGSRYRLSISPSISAVVIAEKLEPADTLPVYPVGKPAVSVQGQTLVLKPTFTVEESNRTQAYHVEIDFLDAAGNWTRKSFGTISPDSTLSVPIPPGSLSVYKVGYETKSGKITWDASLTQAAVDAGPFFNAVNGMAKPYPVRVWELVGFPTQFPLAQLLAPLGDKKEKADLTAWNGQWETLPASTTLVKGRGYLLSVPEAITPQLDPSQGFLLKPDTVPLDTGWQLVANPLLVPIADGSIGLDAAAVSYFHALDWQGSGKGATHHWAIADTLKPFQGYAVRASRKTNLIFNPMKALKPLPKQSQRTAQATQDRLTLAIGFLPTGEAALLYARPGSESRSGQGPDFMKPGFLASWHGPGGPVMLTDSLTSTFVVRTGSAGTIEIKADRKSMDNGILTVWDPIALRLLPLNESSIRLEASPGWNTYQVFNVEPGNISALEAKLRKTGMDPFEILSVSALPGQSRVKLMFRIPGQFGIAESVGLSVYDPRGREITRLSAGPKMPGVQALEIPTRSFPNGLYFLRLAVTARQRTHSLTTPLLQGWNRR
ncbi:MAG TPA: hypothetical protein VJ385_06135, partial [Fibrobacteria bacterium]|nr:hypothetical protein [Fibrobacteria bacterium]